MRRNTTVYCVRFGVFCDNSTCSNNTSIGNMNPAHDNCTKTNPNIVAYNRQLIFSLPTIFFIADTFRIPDRHAYLLIIMIVPPNYAYMICDNNIISYYAIRFNY